MRFGHVEVFVCDLAAARRFYVEVLGAEDVQPESTHVAWVRLGEVEILLRPGTPPPPAADYAGSGRALVLYTDDLAATMERLLGRGLEFRGEDGSPLCPTFRDPDGTWIQLVDPRGP